MNAKYYAEMAADLKYVREVSSTNIQVVNQCHKKAKSQKTQPSPIVNIYSTRL